MSERRVRLDHLLGVYAVGSGDWSWQDEHDNLIDQPGTQKLLARIRDEGIREPILLGTDGRVWDGHHRIVIAMHLGLDSVPVEFAGEDGALAVYTAEKPPAWWRTFWRRTGTVVEYLGVRWELVVVGAADQMWRQWVGVRTHLYCAQQYANVDGTNQNQNQNQKEDSHG